MVDAASLIVLAVTKIGEKTLVVHCLSREWGRRGFVASGIGRSAMFLPLNILDAEVVENPKSDLWRLRTVSARHPLNGIRSSVAKNSMTLFMSEVLYRIVREGAVEDGLFDWCERSILTLDALPVNCANYHLRFLLELCTALGFSASTADLAPFAGARYADIKALMETDLRTFMLYPLSGETRDEIASVILRYLSYHTESRIDVKSLAVLRELFRTL